MKVAMTSSRTTALWAVGCELQTCRLHNSCHLLPFRSHTKSSETLTSQQEKFFPALSLLFLNCSAGNSTDFFVSFHLIIFVFFIDIYVGNIFFIEIYVENIFFIDIYEENIFFIAREGDIILKF